MYRTKFGILAVLATTSFAASQDLYDIDTIRTIEVTAPTNWRTVMASNYPTPTYIKVDVKIDNVLYKDCGARHRGYSTYRYLPSSKRDKRPWKISMDAFVPDQRVQGYRTLNINNNLWDPSFMREVAGYEFMRKFTPASQCCYVKLKVNNEDIGLFVSTQQINKDFLQAWFEDDEGNRYRGERTGRVAVNNTALTWLGPSQAPYTTAYQLKTENGPTPWVDVIQAINVLNNTASSQLPAALPKVLDVDNALRFLAVGNITAWLDSYIGRYCHNFWMYEDPYHDRITFQPWDLNNGFGGLTDGLGENGVQRLSPFYKEISSSSPRPLFSKIVQLPPWRARYLAHFRSMMPDFSWTKMGPRIDALRKLIRPALTADTKRIYTLSQFDANLTTTVRTGFVTVPGLQPFFQNRTAYLAAHTDLKKIAPTLSNLTHSPTAPNPNQSVTVNARVTGVTATNVTLYHRTRGPFVEAPMFDDGKHGDGKANDGVYGAAIPPIAPLHLVDYYVSANNSLSTGAMSFLPDLAEFNADTYRVRGAPPKGPILISEFVAKNDTGLKDENGETDDWIELANVGAQAISVSGMYLTDNVTNPTKWKIPAGQTILPGGTLIFWADDEATQGPLHTSFKLSASGEEVALYAADGKTNLDWIEFGAQSADVSTGRLPGYLGLDFTFPVPLPNQLNQATPCGHVAYGAPDPTAARFALVGQGAPGRGKTVNYVASKAPPSSAGVLFLGFAPFHLDLPGVGPLLFNPFTMLVLPPFQTNASGGGTAPFTIPNINGLGGAMLYFQTLVLRGTTAELSNAVATRICP